jgi:probable rRNA maturation factor
MIEVNNLIQFKFDKKKLESIAKKVLNDEKRNKIELSVVFVGKKEIQKLNKKYRLKNRPTDVLSFAYQDSLGYSPTGEAGEIVICPPVIKENAKKFKEPFSRELNRIFIHGLLHILGYDHEKTEKEAKIMEKKQESYLSKINF